MRFISESLLYYSIAFILFFTSSLSNMEQRFCVSIVIGDLFSGVSSKDGKNRTKPASVLQQEVRDKFVNITSIEVSSHKFNKLKKNKGRKSEKSFTSITKLYLKKHHEKNDDSYNISQLFEERVDMTDELVIDEDYVEEDEFFFEEEPNTESQRESAYFDDDNLDDNEYDLTKEPLPKTLVKIGGNLG